MKFVPDKLKKTLWEKRKMLFDSIFSFSRNVFKRLISLGLLKSRLCCKGLTHYHTILHFDALKIYSCGKQCEKRRNCLSPAISAFLTMFSTL